MGNLLPGEAVVRSGAVVWVGPQGPPRPGTLSVTNQALIFEGPIPWAGGGGRGPMMRPGFGRMGPPRRPGFGPGPAPMAPGELRIPLWRCRGAAVGPGPQGSVLSVQLLSRQIFFSVPEADQWAAAINQARATAPPPPPGALGGGGAGPGMSRAQMPRCDYCGQLSQVSATKCEHCGAPF